MDGEGLKWRKSSRSGGGGGNNCVEFATDGERAYVRDTKDREGGTIVVRPEAWAAFLDTLR